MGDLPMVKQSPKYLSEIILYAKIQEMEEFT
jgi:hypothetical protein